MAAKRNLEGWFEIAVTDLERAKKFYEAVFKVEMNVMEMGPAKLAFFPMHEDAPGAGGALMKGGGYAPTESGTVIYFSVDDIEEILKRVGKNGGKTILAKTTIGEYGFVAHFGDSEGNRIGLHSMK
jgi:uncharacterized protein